MTPSKWWQPLKAEEKPAERRGRRTIPLPTEEDIREAYEVFETQANVADYFGVSVATLRRWFDTYRIVAHRGAPGVIGLHKGIPQYEEWNLPAHIAVRAEQPEQTELTSHWGRVLGRLGLTAEERRGLKTLIDQAVRAKMHIPVVHHPQPNDPVSPAYVHDVSFGRKQMGEERWRQLELKRERETFFLFDDDTNTYRDGEEIRRPYLPVKPVAQLRFERKLTAKECDALTAELRNGSLMGDIIRRYKADGYDMVRNSMYDVKLLPRGRADNRPKMLTNTMRAGGRRVVVPKHTTHVDYDRSRARSRKDWRKALS